MSSVAAHDTSRAFDDLNYIDSSFEDDREGTRPFLCRNVIFTVFPAIYIDLILESPSQ
ncbi:hypothetical protein COLINT_02029 [Collinsella intestinalis DSM 13280]|uniref:Uncharacterized protein n=1 Tax=Collinsella intestinalis DSM 13280 TaxID=521003 RepID=C4F7L4_9ACTN|nr:hypothetical protein COLINT_02029 [Collinsella intestinalis DSM 13280]